MWERAGMAGKGGWGREDGEEGDTRYEEGGKGIEETGKQVKK